MVFRWQPDCLFSPAYTNTILSANTPIELMDACGNHIHQFLHDAIYEQPLSWSLDGQQLAVASLEGLLRYDLRSGIPQKQVLPYPGGDAKWSPDGQAIAFTMVREFVDPNSPDSGLEVIRMNVSTSVIQNLTDNTGINDFAPAWSPDGHLIAFISDADGDPDLYVMNADGTQQRKLAETPDGIIQPDWSPDGQQIIFGTAQGIVYILDANGENMHPLTSADRRFDHPTWRPQTADTRSDC